MTHHASEIASLRARITVLEDAVYTAQETILKLVHAEEARQHSLVDFLIDGGGSRRTRTAVEELMRQRIRRSALYRSAPPKEDE